MAIEQEMYTYFVQLNEAQKRSVVELIKTFLQGDEDDEGRISIEQYNLEIEEAEAAVERGEGISHEEVVRISNGWRHGR